MNLIEPIHEHARKRPHATAIITSRQHISWSVLDNLIWSTAKILSEHGLNPGDRVGLSMAHPVIHLITSLALARMGVAHIAIPVLESHQTRNELVKMLELKCIVCDLEKIRITTPNAFLMNKLAGAKIDTAQQDKLKSPNSHLTWLILQSSGTTGKPKFAELDHATARDRFVRFLTLYGCNSEDIFWTASRPDFAVAKQRLTYSLIAGAAVCLPNMGPISLDLIQFLNRHQVSLACGTPSHLHQMIAIGSPVPSLRAFEARSAFIHEKLRLDFKATINPHLFIVYGTNESDALTLARPTQQSVADTVGFTTESMEIEVVNQHGLPRPALETGEIRVRGPGLVTEYVNNPQATAKAFKAGWFYPGDLGYFTTEGALILQGRTDDLMIFDGMNIYPAEIETVLSSHPAVREAAAFAVNHEQFQDLPVAAVTLKEQASEKHLIDFSKTLLGVKHPRRIFVIKEFPRNQMGKILKRELAAMITKMSGKKLDVATQS